MNVKRMCRIALLTAVICVVAPLSIQTGAIPISLATLAVYIAGICLGPRDAVIAVALYLLIGGAGLPVFSGFSRGFAHIAGPTGGYMIGYLPMALLSGLARGKKAGMRWVLLIAATAACYLLGTVWFIVETGTKPLAALSACVIPFLPGDLLKMLVVALPAKRLEAITA